MPSEQITQHMLELLHQSCMELFEDQSIQSEAAPEYGLPSDTPTAVIDAGNHDLEIQLMIRLPIHVLAITYPGEDQITAVDEELLEDWISELSNRLIGRLKNKLLLHGCSLTMGLPSSYFGTEVDDLIPSGFENYSYYFSVDQELFECNLAIDIINPDMDYRIEEAPDEGPEDGELEFF